MGAVGWRDWEGFTDQTRNLDVTQRMEKEVGGRRGVGNYDVTPVPLQRLEFTSSYCGS